MKTATPTEPQITAQNPGSLVALSFSFRRALLAQNKSPQTIRSYMIAIRQLGDYLISRGMPTNIEAVRREHVESFMGSVVAARKPSTAAIRYKALQQYFKWAEEEGEISASPMRRMKAPTIPEAPPPVLTDEQIRKLLKACEGRDFTARRDNAILRLLLDTGMRRAEIMGLRLPDIDWEAQLVYVVGKGRRPRACPFGKKTAQALDRYVRSRDVHPKAEGSDALWIGRHGPAKLNLIRDLLERRCRQAGLGHVYPHLFRHFFAHKWLADGGQETDLMSLGGWKSRTIMSRYGSSAADSRARQSHKRFGPGDKF